LHLTRDDLRECVEAAAAEARAHGGFDQTAELWRNRIGGLALTVLLYLAGEPDIVGIVHPGEKPNKESLRRRDPERWRDLAESNQYAVGKDFTRAIERWEVEHGRDASVEMGRTIRPHMRALIRICTGTRAGQEVPLVRFLLPVSVKGGAAVEEPEAPVAGKVG